MKKTTIIAVVGPSGSGKTTAVEFASKALGIPVLVSYTTRPMREGEVNYKDHIFVADKDIPSQSRMLAFTKFGGYQYWTEKAQVEKHEKVFYVIDEKGLTTLMDKFGERYDVVPIRVECTRMPWIDDNQRLNRDNARIYLPKDMFATTVYNDGTLEKFLFKFTAAINNTLWLQKHADQF